MRIVARLRAAQSYGEKRTRRTDVEWRRHILGFEAEGRRSTGKAGTGRKNYHHRKLFCEVSAINSKSRPPHYCDARLAYHAGLVLRAHGASLDAGLNLQTAQTYLGGGIGIDGPALMPVLTFSPRAIVWLCCGVA
jgi:hypothetical protein